MDSAVPEQLTKRLRLREVQEHDWMFVHDMREAGTVETDLNRRSEQESKELVARIIEARANRPRLLYRFVVVLRDSDQPIGWCDLYVNGAQSDTVEIGYRIDARYSGKGYATEAAQAAITFAFDVLKARTVWAECTPDHQASIRVLQKLGMRPASDSTQYGGSEGKLYFEMGRE